MKGMGSNAMNFGKSPAKLLTKGQNKITFKDVAGVDEAIEELQEIVEFLKIHRNSLLSADIFQKVFFALVLQEQVKP